MGGSSNSTPPPPPKTPPPPAEDISAEVIAPTMRQEAARRARTGAYVTKGQKIGAGGQLLGASPIQLANVRAASSAPQIEKKKTIEEFNPELQAKLEKARASGPRGAGGLALTKKQQKIQYGEYILDYNKRAAELKRIQSSTGMTI